MRIGAPVLLPDGGDMGINEIKDDEGERVRRARD